MRRVNVHLEEQQIEGLRELKQRTGVPVNTLVRRAVARFLADAEKRGIPAIVFDTRPDTAKSSQTK